MRMGASLALVLSMGLIACTSQFNAVANRISQGADAEVEMLERLYCDGITTGAYERHFRGRPELKQHYDGLCFNSMQGPEIVDGGGDDL